MNRDTEQLIWEAVAAIAAVGATAAILAAWLLS